MKISKSLSLICCLIAYSQVNAAPINISKRPKVTAQPSAPSQTPKSTPAAASHLNPQVAETAKPASDSKPAPSAQPASSSQPAPSSQPTGPTQFQFPEYGQIGKTESEKVPSNTVELPYQDSGFHLTAQFLYWQTLEDNLAYGINQPAGSSEVVLLGEMKKNGYRWDPGVRAGLGYIFTPDSWDIEFEYTYFYNSGGRSGAPKEGGTLAGLFPTDPLTSSNISRIKSEVNLQYHTIDLIMIHTFYTTPSYMMRFSLGGRGAWISQSFDASYHTENPSLEFFPGNTEVHNKWKLAGGGMRAGLTFDWFIAFGFSLHFEGMAGAVLGQYNNWQNIYHKNKYQTNYTSGDVKPKNKRIVPNYQLQIGIDWRLAMQNANVKVFGAWELNMWSELNQVYYYPQTTADQSKLGSWSRDSINIQGLTAGFVFEF